MTVGLRGRAASAGAGLLFVCVSACSPAGHTEMPAPAVTAELTAGVPAHLTVGVVVSQTSQPGEGAQWRDAAEGTRVAASRFAMGGATVTLVPVNDKGTTDGAVAAVTMLADHGVAGVVLATSGDHVRSALQEASARQLPVLMPYVAGSQGLPAGAWLTGPAATTTDQRLVEALHSRGLSKPLLIDAGGADVEGLSPAASDVFVPGGDVAAFAIRLAARQKKSLTSFDAVVISGPAALQGLVVSALKGAGVDAPVFLSSDALSPTFPEAVSRAGGSLAGSFVAAGLDDGDVRALEPTESGRALSAYFSALSVTAADSETTDLFGERPFSEVAGAADVRSHDAVVALVRAAETANSTDPAKVATNLSGLRLGSPDGLAGASLDFSHATAVADGDVVALAATPVSPGMRPPSNAPALFWFAAAPP